MKKSLIIIILSLLAASCGKKTAETKPIRKDVTESVFASGILEAKGTYDLTAQSDGYLLSINFEQGDLIYKGQILAELDNRESDFNTQSASDLFRISQFNMSSNAPALVQAQSAITLAKQKLELDSLQERRYKSLSERNSIAKVDYENVRYTYNTSKSNYQTAVENYKKLKQEAQQQLITNKAAKEINKIILSKNEIKAIVPGRVYKKLKQQGDFVKKGDVIATIGDADIIYAKVNIDETNISKIKIGQHAVVQLNINKNKNYRGVVSEIYSSFDDATQSFICKIYFEDNIGFNIVNTQLQANIIIGVQKNALLIPRNYLDFSNYVQIKGQKEKTKVITNFISNDWVQVISGIDQNTTLITENLPENNIKTSEAGSQLK
ncbi:efflux RND transporter periplasmic adaptor subunit [Flavobacterium sp. CF136]|uniref:efflux RND transporter periplasmic adaptor subunit n=1 Tax=Flavobacterium sp. (strain CF136) TaxID=1144313 RepID=UPI0002718589|nr:HlyD family efflux transporter periplasmic adaptor subunit [Flavobacterium sp. CF136]EJL62781.1 multidrug resistance efflux pump [Flavobacterium sp. CF136]